LGIPFRGTPSLADPVATGKVPEWDPFTSHCQDRVGRGWIASRANPQRLWWLLAAFGSACRGEGHHPTPWPFWAAWTRCRACSSRMTASRTGPGSDCHQAIIWPKGGSCGWFPVARKHGPASAFSVTPVANRAETPWDTARCSSPIRSTPSLAAVSAPNCALRPTHFFRASCLGTLCRRLHARPTS